jgi:hypothetical protein
VRVRARTRAMKSINPQTRPHYFQRTDDAAQRGATCITPRPPPVSLDGERVRQQQVVAARPLAGVPLVLARRKRAVAVLVGAHDPGLVEAAVLRSRVCVCRCVCMCVWGEEGWVHTTQGSLKLRGRGFGAGCVRVVCRCVCKGVWGPERLCVRASQRQSAPPVPPC